MFNYWGIFLIVLILIPNIFYGFMQKDSFSDLWQNKTVEAFEQVGRYGCILFMIIQIPGTGLRAENLKTAYYLTTGLLSFVYFVLFFLLVNKKALLPALLLSLLPSLVFISFAVFNNSIFLLAAALVFAPCHIAISIANNYYLWNLYNGPVLEYAKKNLESFPVISKASTEIRSFEFNGKKYIVKTPLYIGEKLSPFWAMMDRIFDFSITRQYGSGRLEYIYNCLKDNGYIDIVPFVCATENCAIFEYVDGKSFDDDVFPMTEDNAFRLGAFAGFMHNNIPVKTETGEKQHKFWKKVLFHISERVRETGFFSDTLRTFEDMEFATEKNVMMIADMCADQYLYDENNRIKCLVDIDACVSGPVEWDLTFWKKFVPDWESFTKGYEQFGKMPEFEKWSWTFETLMDMNK